MSKFENNMPIPPILHCLCDLLNWKIAFLSFSLTFDFHHTEPPTFWIIHAHPTTSRIKSISAALNTMKLYRGIKTNFSLTSVWFREKRGALPLPFFLASFYFVFQPNPEGNRGSAIDILTPNWSVRVLKRRRVYRIEGKKTEENFLLGLKRNLWSETESRYTLIFLRHKMGFMLILHSKEDGKWIAFTVFKCWRHL